MPSMKDLLGDNFYATHYPATPGYREPTTSKAAAIAIGPTAATLRHKVLSKIQAAGARGLTADECAGELGESILTIRPRVSELFAYGKIKNSGTKRRNGSTRLAIAWIAA